MTNNDQHALAASPLLCSRPNSSLGTDGDLVEEGGQLPPEHPDADAGTDAVALDRFAQEIIARLDKADAMQGKADAIQSKALDHRIAAGLLLEKARKLVPRGQWGRWVAANIKRSRQDVHRCLALVKSNDPAEQRQARERERAQVREQVRRSRATAVVTYVCDKSLPSGAGPATDRLDEIKRLVAKFDDPLDVIKALISELNGVAIEPLKKWFYRHLEDRSAALTRINGASTTSSQSLAEVPDQDGSSVVDYTIDNRREPIAGLAASDSDGASVAANPPDDTSSNPGPGTVTWGEAWVPDDREGVTAAGDSVNPIPPPLHDAAGHADPSVGTTDRPHALDDGSAAPVGAGVGMCSPGPSEHADNDSTGLGPAALGVGSTDPAAREGSSATPLAKDGGFNDPVAGGDGASPIVLVLADKIDAEPVPRPASDPPLIPAEIEPSTPAPGTEPPAADLFEEAQEPEDEPTGSGRSKLDPMHSDARAEPHATEPQKRDGHELSEASNVDAAKNLRAASLGSPGAEPKAFSEASPRIMAALLERPGPVAPTTPVGVTCRAPHSRCRYTSCAQSNHCIVTVREVAA